ncbi:MAG: hypothetical protein ACPLRO_04945 [Candidatus Kapaibacteriota bacterium]
MKKTFTILLISLILSGCKVIDFIFHPEHYQRTSKVRVTEYVYDTIKVANYNGNFSTTVAGFPSKRIVFNEIGQSYTLRPGELVEFVFDFDLAQASFDVTTDLQTKEITLTLVQKDTSKVYLTSQCQTVKRFQTGTLPIVEVASNLDPQQIVITPMFNLNCEVVGYEFRYGSEESGCKAAAKETLQRFVECTKKGSSKKISQRKEKNCINELLGLPCK